MGWLDRRVQVTFADITAALALRELLLERIRGDPVLGKYFDEIGFNTQAQMVKIPKKPELLALVAEIIKEKHLQRQIITVTKIKPHILGIQQQSDSERHHATQVEVHFTSKDAARKFSNKLHELVNKYPQLKTMDGQIILLKKMVIFPHQKDVIGLSKLAFRQTKTDSEIDKVIGEQKDFILI